MISVAKLAKIKDAAGRIASFCGVRLDDVEFVVELGHNILRLTIDNENGVSTSDCESVSRAFSKKMDELDLITEHYFLEVTSPGKGEFPTVPDLNNIK